MAAHREEPRDGLAAFGALLEDEYGRPFPDWLEASAFGDREAHQVARALEALVLAPIADCLAASAAEIAASETGARTVRTLSDEKIAGTDWEGSWQWELLAAIDNATKDATGGMVTPADPRMLVLRTRYGSTFFALLAAHLSEHLCGRAVAQAFEARPAALSNVSTERAAALRRVPGLERASPAFLAGLAFLIDRLGAKAFCAWCEDPC